MGSAADGSELQTCRNPSTSIPLTVRLRLDNVGYSGIFWDIRGGMFFRKDSLKSEGRCHTHPKINTRPAGKTCHLSGQAVRPTCVARSWLVTIDRALSWVGRYIHYPRARALVNCSCYDDIVSVTTETCFGVRRRASACIII